MLFIIRKQDESSYTKKAKDGVLPNGYDLAHFENGVKPVFTDDGHGNLYLKPNAMVITDY